MDLLITIVLAIGIFIVQECRSKARERRSKTQIIELISEKMVMIRDDQKLAEVDKQFGKFIEDQGPSDYMKLGNKEYAKKNYTEAIKYYDEALKLKQKYVYAWVSKGYAFRKLNKYSEELKAYEKAIELKESKSENNPDSAWIWVLKGYALQGLGRYGKALKASNKTIELKKDYVEAWVLKGYALDGLGRREKALKAWDKANELRSLRNRNK